MQINTRIHLIALFCIISSYTASATTAEDSISLQALKFEMIRQAVIFYSTDTLLYKDNTQLHCGEALSISGLQKCAIKMTGVGDRIKSFNEVAVDGKQDLKKLKEEIIKQVSTKAYRVKTEGYQSFIEKLESLATSAPEVVAPIKKMDAPIRSSPPPGIQNTPAPLPDISPTPSVWNIIAMLLSLIALVFSGLALKSKRRKSRPSLSANNNSLQNHSASNESNFLYDQLVKKQRTLEDQLAGIQSQLKPQQPKDDTQRNSIDTGANTSQTAHPVKIVKYAKTADGNAFDADTLSDAPDNKKIYELTFESTDKGSFRVTTNKEAQLFALEDPNNYLRGACNYRSSPNYNSRIITDTPGRIERNGKKWTIVKPAEIDFS